MRKLKAEPPDELLVRIELIGDIKRRLSPTDRSLSSGSGVYVQSAGAPGAVIQYMAGGGKWSADLIFLSKPDGTREVKKYKPGQWERKVESTLAICDALHRVSLVPQGWSEEKMAAYEAVGPVDPRLLAEVALQVERHRGELSILSGENWMRERERLAQVFLDELQKEWPVEYLETLMTSSRYGGSVRPVIAASVDCVFQAYVYGYMMGQGWISGNYMSAACLELGNRLASAARAAFKNARSRGTGFGVALALVGAEGATRAALDRQRATDFGVDQGTNPLRMSEPPEELLRKIEYIADLKRGITGEYNRSLIRVCGVFVDSRELPDGTMLYAASGGEGSPSLVFERLEDGSRKVEVYQAGDWEKGIDDTVALARCLARIERTPQEWPGEKQKAYEDTLSMYCDRKLLAELGEQRKRHARDLDSIFVGTCEDEWMRLADVYLDELAREWPIEYLDILLSGFKDVYGRPELKSEFPIERLETQDGPDLLTKMSLLAVQAAYVYGYMCGRGWITSIHMAAGCMDLGRGVARTAWVRRTRSKCKGTGFGGGLLMVAAEGQVLAANEKSSR